jgi:hypothetical protein
MPFFAVTYTYTDAADRRDVHRPAHRAFLRELFDAGKLAASGPFAAADGRPDGALLVVRADDEAAALALLGADPFLLQGLIDDRTARGWVPVTGPWADEV